MEKWGFNSMLSKKELYQGRGIRKSPSNLGSIENTCRGEDPNRNSTNIHSLRIDSKSYSYKNVDCFFGVRNFQTFISDDTFLVRDSKGDGYSVYLDTEKNLFEIDNDFSFLSELQRFFSNYWNSSNLNTESNGSKSDDPYYNYYAGDSKYSWNNHIHSSIENYLHSQMRIKSSVFGSSDNYSDSYLSSYIWGERRGFGVRTSTNSSIRRKLLNNRHNLTQKYRHLWIQCENCYELNYKKLLKSKMNICEQCGYHLKMSSSERIELSIDPGTWNPMDEDMVSLDPIGFHSEEEPYKDRIDSYQKKTGLTDAVQTGIGQLNGIPVAIGVMDFQFMGGSMGSVVGEKITRLIEYASNQFLPLIIVCASGGARMQEGSLSLMQMAKISSALFDYQSKKKLFYVAVLTSPTTGGVTASFGMLGDIIIAEPNAYIAFAGKRVIEQTLNKTVPEGSQASEHLFHKGLFDSIVPRNPLKDVLSELFQLHSFFPFNQKKVEHESQL
uniref:Acetyl-coenzyme A carboxylase carboxyl transferase subunit beta n=1 Tax=Frankenia laevis TaxID=122303 RepID=A0A411JR99_9CARY|nr:acetyl-CoA carboxylase carboxyltransferase beta subunit [Frankenia laevis]QBC67606.1 acetyl-CoA carboxylase carboxyltransferase beta subunit [Frankenia laevis]